MKFVIEKNGFRVGISSCKDCSEGQPYVTKAKSVEEMLENIVRPDVKDRHEGKPDVYACQVCIGA